MKAGFVSIIGKPNAGKSTLLNRLIKTKLAAVSRKPQTTRRVIRGILNDSRGQVVYLDTPGFHTPRDPLGKFMIRQAVSTFLDADVFYFLCEPIEPCNDDLDLIQKMREETKDKPVFCLVNKVDQIEKPKLLPVLDRYQKEFPFREIIPISALHGDQVDVLLAKTFEHLPTHEPYFPSDITSDQTERFIAEELIREKVFRFTGEEIPYATTVQIGEFKDEAQLIRIDATVFVEKESQKAILIGAGGKKMKEIGTAARLDLEKFFEKKVFLKLWVKTLKNWRRDERGLTQLGFGD